MYNPYAQSVPDYNQQQGNAYSNTNQQYQQHSNQQQFYQQNRDGTQFYPNDQQQQFQQQPHNQQNTQQQQFYDQSRGINGQPGNNDFNAFLHDPRTTMGLQFSQSAFNASQQYVQQNIGQFVQVSDIKYYFKVSNSYVVNKLFMILFPYRNKTWTRILRASSDVNSNGVELYAYPTEDINAPDLYIPLMGLVTYVLLWAIFAGIEGSFHPQLLGYATTRTIAFYLIDICFLKASFYVLSIKNKNWDVVAYSGYKYVTILFVMLAKHLFSHSKVSVYISFLSVFCSLGFFLMRSLRYVVFPSGMSSNTISPAQRKIRTNFLFIYSFVIQFFLVWLMS